MKNVIITGASGFLGEKLVERLCREGIRVYAIVRSKNSIKHLVYKNLIIIELDMSEYNAINKIITEPIDVFFHLAWDGVFGIKRSNYNIQLKNIKYSCDCVNVAAKMNVGKFIFLGTMSQYQRQSNIYKGLGENNIYGIAKLTANQMMRNLAYQNHMKYISCIVSNVYGPNSNQESFIIYVLIRMLHNKKIKLTSCEQLADFIYIDDAIEALYLIGKNVNLKDEYYIGNEKPKKLKEFIITIRDLIDTNLKIGFNEVEFNGIEIDYKKINTKSLLDEYNFKCMVKFDEGIKKLITFWRKDI